MAFLRRILLFPALLASGLILLLVLFAPRPAFAGNLTETQAELEAAYQQLSSLQDELDRYAEAYADAETRQAEIDDAILATEADEKRSGQDLTKAQQQLNERMVNLYKGRGSSLETLLEVFLTRKDFVAALTEFEFLKKVAGQDQDLFASIGRHLENVDVRRQDLAAKKVEQTQRLSELQDAQADLESQVQAVASEYDDLKARVAALEEEERLEREAAARAAAIPAGSGRAVRGFVFPVDGAHSFADTWGEPRSGGRAHQGSDIFAQRGTPCVACVSGVVTQTWWDDGLGGTGIWLSGDHGVDYYYAHLDSIADGINPGVRVRAGQVIGYVGDSGNAQGGPCHLHFQAHPGGGSPVDPYPVLAASD